MIFGRYGLEKVAYLDSYTGKYRGAFTCHTYPVSPERAVFWVDKRDLAEMMRINNADGVAVFTKG